MSAPTKLVIEITGKTYSHKLLDETGAELWSDEHIMESAGHSRHAKESGGDIFESPVADDYEELAKAIDDLSFGPFGVAGALRNIAD